MSFKEFARDDVIFNTIKTHPEYEFHIYNNQLLLDNKKGLSPIKSGYVSLYEANVNRAPNNRIYPFVYKGSSRDAMKTVSVGTFNSTDQYGFGDMIKGSYPLSASISRTIIPAGAYFARYTYEDRNGTPLGTYTAPNSNKKYINSLINITDSYTRLSRHFHFKIDDGSMEWNKGTQKINLISVPSIFFGSTIKRGQVSLKYYHTGSLISEVSDLYQNGELVVTTGSNKGEVAGVVMYDHGFIMLTGSWSINSVTGPFDGTGTNVPPKWNNFGIGMPEFGSTTTAAAITDHSFSLSFKGTNEISTVTLFAHAEKGEYNFSTNLTAVEFDNQPTKKLSEKKMSLGKSRFKNVVESPFISHSEEYQSEVYISKIGIYDSYKNLLGYAILSKPIRKTEVRDFTFKLKLDV